MDDSSKCICNGFLCAGRLTISSFANCHMVFVSPNRNLRRNSKKYKNAAQILGLFCSPLFQHSLGNTQHGANLGAEKRPKKRGWKSALKTAFLQTIWITNCIQGAPLRQIPLKPCGHEPSFPKGNPQVCQMLRIHCLRCHHTFRSPQCCPAINAIIRIIKVKWK